MLSIFNGNSWSTCQRPKRKKERKPPGSFDTFHTCRLWIRVHSAESARGLFTVCLLSQLSWCKCHMTPAWISVDQNARPDGETGIPDCVFVKNRARACRRCCRSSSAREPSVTAAPGTALRQRSSGKTVSTGRYYTYGYKRALYATVNSVTTPRQTDVFFSPQ